MGGIVEKTSGIMVIETEAPRRMLFSVVDQNGAFITGFSYLAYSNREGTRGRMEFYSSTPQVPGDLRETEPSMKPTSAARRRMF